MISAEHVSLFHAALGALAGLMVHLAFFIRGEWHMRGGQIVSTHILAGFMTGLLLVQVQGNSVSIALLTLIELGLSYAISLFSSILIYRACFHPLAGFSGPRLARLSKLWHVWHVRTSKNHLVLDQIIHKHGYIVRTGPVELIITHPDVYQMVDGSGNICGKAEAYDLPKPDESIVTGRDKKAHDARRRIWDQGFSSKALTRYIMKAKTYIDQMETIVEQHATEGQPLDVTTLFSWITYDFMLDFAFAKPVGMLETQTWDHLVLEMKAGMDTVGPLAPTIWLSRFLLNFKRLLPSVQRWFQLLDSCRSQIRERIKTHVPDKTEDADVSYHLIEDARRNGFRETDLRWLDGDAFNLVVAGSDTTSTVLVAMVYSLAKDPSIQQKLSSEITMVDVSDDKILQRLPYLNGVIQETLRLFNPVPTGGARKVGDTGIYIGGTYIPPYTTIFSPRYSVFRREDCFERPLDFVPERWTDRPDMVKNKRVFAPFAVGRFSCIGKQLAMSELRLTIALLVKKYQIGFYDEADREKWPASICDNFTVKVGELNIKFTNR